MTEFMRVLPAPESPLSESVRVRTRDGVHLATDVYLPEGDRSPGDTILIRLPYDKNGEYTFIPLIAEYFMLHGYRVVAQDVRGKFRSEGDALLFVNEVADGEDTLNWIEQQPWSNGRVAMWGDSYYGYTQWAAAASGHPALKAISPRVTGTWLGEPPRRNPEDRTRRVDWAITNMYPLTHFHSNDTFYWDIDWSRRDFAKQAEAFMADTGRSISYDQFVPNPVLLPRFPQGSAFAGRSVPALHTIGWWDNCAPLSWADVEEIAQHPNWDAHHYLRIESIDHESYQLLELEEDRVLERSEDQIRALLPRTLDPTLEFFEVFVRGNTRPSELPRVTWNLAGTDEWRQDATWPPAGTRTERIRATAAGELKFDGSSASEQTRAPGSTNVAHAPTTDGESARTEPPTELSWVHDPLDLVPSSVENAFAYLLELPNEAPIGDRDDVLRFTSAEAREDVELVGPVKARVRIRSTGPVMDCFVRLLDVAPDGTALRIARGELQLRRANSDQPSELLEINLGQVGYLLRAGHKLRAHVSSSDYPEYMPQPGTGGDPWTEGEVTEQNTQHLLVGGPDGFSIELSVLKGTLA